MSYIFDQVLKTKRKYKTGDPYELLDSMNVIWRESFNYDVNGLKGYCFSANRTDFAIINGKLAPQEKRIVACHEAAHLILHRDVLKNAPMKDFVLYDITSQTEYEANLFAADFLIEDGDVSTLASDNNEYFKICSILQISPELMSFKLLSLTKRGYKYNLPMIPDSRFLGK